VVPPLPLLLPLLLLHHQPPPVESQDSPDSDMLPDKWEETKAHLHPSEPQHLLLPQLPLPHQPLLLHHQPLLPQSFLDSHMLPDKKWATNKDWDLSSLLVVLLEQAEPEHLPPPPTT
jgi:hypothetical protein